MADKYINADKLKEKIIAEQKNANMGMSVICDWFIEAINNEPAADVQPVIHAEWILFDKDCCGRAFYCSNCRKVTTTDDFENTPLEREEYFCSRCRADMRNE